ncbi:MAG: nitroreductase [Parvibaculaceae bacterium]|nr:nitroreductase [Parvibaculaceae bacterium]
MDLDIALDTRRSARAFKDTPVPKELVEELLLRASRSPSGTNVQPWKVYVAMGATRDRLSEELLAYRETHPDDGGKEWPSNSKRIEPYISRMRKLGKDMYTLLEIPKGDKQANWDQWGRNYKFFDAPVGLIFTIDKDLDRTSWLDIGMFMQTLMLSATACGLDTCAQGAWNQFWRVTKDVLDIPDDEYVVCGMSLGYADETAAVNTLVAEREPLSSFAFFR